MTGLPDHPMIVDVCGTLVHDDTTLGLLSHHFRQGPGAAWRWRAARFRLLSAPPVRLGFAVLEKLSGQQVYKTQLIALLRGQPVAALDESAQGYAAHLLARGRCAHVTAAIAPAAYAGRLVLASASLAPIVAALAARLGVPFVASQLGQHDGRLTGKITVDLTGAKAAALAALNGTKLAPGHYDMISDNFSDLSMLRDASEAVVVLRAPAHRRRWDGKLSARFIDVYPDP